MSVPLFLAFLTLRGAFECHPCHQELLAFLSNILFCCGSTVVSPAILLVGSILS